MSQAIDFKSGDVCQIVNNFFTINGFERRLDKRVVTLGSKQLQSGYHHDHSQTWWRMEEIPGVLIEQSRLTPISGLQKRGVE
jgi:hypothetical protein